MFRINLLGRAVLAAAVCVSMVSVNTQADIFDGLMAHYTFDGNANDSSGNGNNATVYGAQLTEDRFGIANQAYLFDGLDDTIEAPHSSSLDITGPITVSCWVNAQDTYYWRSGLVIKAPDYDPSVGYHLRTFEDKASLGLYYGVGSSHYGDEVTSNTIVINGEWHLVTGTYDGSTMRMYIDGQLETSTPYSAGYDSNTAALQIGHLYYPYHDGREGRNDVSLNGAIDDVRIYDRALNSLEVRMLVNSVAPPQVEQPDPVTPPVHTSQYNYVIGAQPYFQWDGITVGLDLDLSIPTMDPIGYHPSFTYPEEPITPEMSPWEVPFSTNSKLLGTLLSAAAPIEFNAIELTGLARLSADATAEAGIYLEDEADHADIGASIGAGLNLNLNLTASSDLLDLLPNIINDIIPTEFEFTYPILGTPVFESSEMEVPLGGWNFDIDVFRQALADVDPLDGYFTIDDINGAVNILSVPMNFLDTDYDGVPDEASITIGASASAYAETSATAGLDFYFREVDEMGNPVESKSIFDSFAYLWNKSVEIADDTIFKSDTGEIEIDIDGLLEMTTGSPVWMMTIIDIEEYTNLLAFEAQFTSEEGAEGLLQIYWDDELVATIDERLAGDELESYIFSLCGTYEASSYELAFRLDPYTDISSSVLIGSITTGYIQSIPEPGSVMLLAIGGMGMMRRRRSA